MEASSAMLARADRLFAVWDGKPARGYGGTADVVAEARQRGVPVTVIWPEGASRTRTAAQRRPQDRPRTRLAPGNNPQMACPKTAAAAERSWPNRITER